MVTTIYAFPCLFHTAGFDGMNDKYRSTFTAENGDTWEFEYDYATETGVVRGSDIDDDEEYKVIEGVAYNLVMDRAEKRWLLAAWEEATGRESGFHDLAGA
jgi:hypothetical protein